jgi:hypothetical protein
VCVLHDMAHTVSHNCRKWDMGVWVCYWSDQMEENEMGGTCSTMGERKCVYRVLMGKPERKRPLGRPRHRWDDNIKVDLQESGMWGRILDRAGLG